MKKTFAFLLTAVGSIAVYETLKHYGVIDQVRGKFEQGYGKVTNDPMTQVKGVFHSGKGELKETVQDVKQTISNTIDDIRD